MSPRAGGGQEGGGARAGTEGGGPTPPEGAGRGASGGEGSGAGSPGPVHRRKGGPRQNMRSAARGLGLCRPRAARNPWGGPYSMSFNRSRRGECGTAQTAGGAGCVSGTAPRDGPPAGLRRDLRGPSIGASGGRGTGPTAARRGTCARARRAAKARPPGGPKSPRWGSAAECRLPSIGSPRGGAARSRCTTTGTQHGGVVRGRAPGAAFRAGRAGRRRRRRPEGALLPGDNGERRRRRPPEECA
jgi:hypothetical protein